MFSYIKKYIWLNKASYDYNRIQFGKEVDVHFNANFKS